MNEIREHMKVIDAQGQQVGTVDHMEGDKFIKLTRNDSPDGEHHWINRQLVQSVDGDTVKLSRTVDEVRQRWHNVNPLGTESSMNGTDESY